MKLLIQYAPCMMTLSMVAVVGWPGGYKLSLPLRCHIRDSLHWYVRRSKSFTLQSLIGSSFAKIKMYMK
jgi:hypothetical protein